MRHATYRRGAPVLLAGVVVVALAIAGILGIGWAADRGGKRARAAFSSAPSSATSISTAREASHVRVPVVTDPPGAAVYDHGHGERTLLCSPTPCEIRTSPELARGMIVSLELAGYDAAEAHVKDVVDVPGGSLTLTFRPSTGMGLATRTLYSPSVRQGFTKVVGRLPPEVVQRIVRQNFGRFRLCYENGLRGNPALTGRVVARFVIDRTGAVSSTADGGSDLPDQGVVGCVIRGFSALSFPQPDTGTVTVDFPILFNPG